MIRLLLALFPSIQHTIPTYSRDRDGNVQKSGGRDTLSSHRPTLARDSMLNMLGQASVPCGLAVDGHIKVYV